MSSSLSIGSTYSVGIVPTYCKRARFNFQLTTPFIIGFITGRDIQLNLESNKAGLCVNKYFVFEILRAKETNLQSSTDLFDQF